MIDGEDGEVGDIGDRRERQRPAEEALEVVVRNKLGGTVGFCVW